MKQIVEQLNKIAKKIDANVDIPDSDLIIDSLDAITKAYGGTPNDSNLIVDKLEDIAGVASKGGGGGSSEIALIPEQTVSLEPYGEGTPLGIAELTGVTIDPEAHFSAIPVKINNELYLLEYDDTINDGLGGYVKPFAPVVMISYKAQENKWYVITIGTGNMAISSSYQSGSPSMEIKLVTTNEPSDLITLPFDNFGSFNNNISLQADTYRTVNGLLGLRLMMDENEESHYAITLENDEHGSGFNAELCTGENCEIEVDEEDNHYIYITVVNNELPASAVITMLGSVV